MTLGKDLLHYPPWIRRAAGVFAVVDEYGPLGPDLNGKLHPERGTVVHKYKWIAYCEVIEKCFKDRNKPCLEYCGQLLEDALSPEEYELYIKGFPKDKLFTGVSKNEGWEDYKEED